MSPRTSQNKASVHGLAIDTVLTPLCCGCAHRYDFATVHSTAKGLFTSIDCFMYGAEVSSLLLWWGDVTAMRAGVAKVLDAHAKVLGSVQRGETSAETCAYEAFCACACLAQPLLAADEFELLREFLANSMVGLALTDDAVHAGVASFWAGAFGAWKSEDGHCHTTLNTWLLVVRGLTALVEEDTESNRAILREWLPPPDELLRISEYECAWRAKPLGAADPALLCARLHGERLGKLGDGRGGGERRAYHRAVQPAAAHGGVPATRTRKACTWRGPGCGGSGRVCRGRSGRSAVRVARDACFARPAAVVRDGRGGGCAVTAVGCGGTGGGVG